MLAFVRDQDLAAASSRCRVVGSYRGKAKQAVVNRAFPRLTRPILPGFNFFVDADVYADTDTRSQNLYSFTGDLQRYRTF